jgi:hypothetical protein
MTILFGFIIFVATLEVSSLPLQELFSNIVLAAGTERFFLVLGKFSLLVLGLFSERNPCARFQTKRILDRFCGEFHPQSSYPSLLTIGFS